MLRPLRCIALIGLLMAIIVLPGCPSLAPDLSVTPLALNFGVDENSKTLRIQNRGGGTLTWTASVSEGAPWLSLEALSGGKQVQTVDGEATTEIDTIGLNVNRAVLAESSSRSASVVITSNGGTQTVSVSVSAAGPAQLEVSPTALSFGATRNTLEVTIGNGGAGALSWSLEIAGDAPWLTATPSGNDNLAPGSTDTVEFVVDRSGLPGGDFSTPVSVSSNGGSAEIAVTMSVPPLVVSTNTLDFGSITDAAARTFAITNPSGATVDVQLSTSHGGAGLEWFSIANPVTEIPALETLGLEVLASPAGLEPGAYNGTITVEAPALDFSATINVLMAVSGFAVSPGSVDFGTITETQQSSFVIENLTNDPLPFAIVIPSGHPWLTVVPESGSLTGQQTIQLTADPTAVDPGEFTAEVAVNFGEAGSGLSETVTVSMGRPEPARLEASPRNILFGTGRIEQRLALWNAGIGTVNWRIDASGFPNWLSLSPVDGDGVAAGTVSGEETDEVVLRVDRDRAPADAFELAHAFDVVASGDADSTIAINVSASIAQVPVFVLEADAVDDRGISTLAIPSGEDTRTFVIRNEGTGTLSWEFGERPAWVSSLTPAQGSLDPNNQQTVTIRVSREGLSAPGEQEILEITTNDPENATALLDVSVSVPPLILITNRPGAIGYQENQNTELLEVANDGDPGTTLNYRVISNQEWLSVSPATGSSVGTASSIKDFKEHSVSIDRSRLDGENASARLIIRAFLVEDGVAVPDPTIPPVEIPVTVEAAGLTIESALPRTRVPSLIRNVVSLRNVRSEAIPIPNSRLDEVGRLFRFSENDVGLELSESNQFLKQDFSANVLILLDFSGSMLASAQAAVEDGQLGEPANLTGDALKSVYLNCIPLLIDELPAHYRVGLGFFNDHAIPEQGTVRMVNPNDGEPAFTRDKSTLQARLTSIDVQDNGATDLIPAVIQGTSILTAQDRNDNLLPFDDADMKAMVVFTDGRDTSLGRVTDASNFAAERHVRLFTIGWGEQVNADPIVRMAGATGGHYYSTSGRPTGELDPFGVPIRVPQVSDLVDWCHLDPADECDQSIANDFDSQVVFNYTTLTSEASVTVNADLTFNDPNDQNSACLSEQGTISANATYPQLDFSVISGDARAGQIALHTEGIADGEALVVARADYIPRNVQRLSFDISVSSLESPSINVTRAPQTAGGLIADWDTGGAPPTYTFSSPDGAPIRFADHGDLIYIRVSNVTQPFTLNFEVIDPLYDPGNVETKYFTHPDSILVEGGEFLATSFPAPFFDSRPAPITNDEVFIIDLDDGVDQVEIDVFNLGGSHVPPGAVPNPITGEFSPNGIVNIGLYWEAMISSDAGFLSFEENTQETGFVTSTFTPSTVFINVDRAPLPPGPRIGQVFFAYGYGSINVSGTTTPITIQYDILRPAFSLSETFINFGFTPDTQEVTITNTGQSTLEWEADESSFPDWVFLSDFTGTAGPGEDSFTTINIVREELPEGEQEFDIVFQADFAIDPAVLTVAAEGLPAP